MRRVSDNIVNKMDWITGLIYLVLILMGWFNIFAAVYDDSSGAAPSIFSFSSNSGKQLLWIGVCILTIIVIMAIDFKFYESFAPILYGVMILFLILVMFLADEVSGARSWFQVGPAKFQPSEFSKLSTALLVAWIFKDQSFKADRLKNHLLLFAAIALPALLIIIQGDAGTALVFGVFALVFYREGMQPLYLVLGTSLVFVFVLTLLLPNSYLYSSLLILSVLVGGYTYLSNKNTKITLIVLAIAGAASASILSVDYFINNVLQPHQQNRIKAFINPEADPRGYGYNVIQSKIAIGSGGLSGKGFLKGTQTTGDYVPEQSTDFIFCTIGEEHGWLGSFVVIAFFIALLLRVLYIAERQKWRFARVYGYSVACILFFHFMVNIGMTIGLFPVIGIPLPFFSYGGSSLWSFTILLFVLVKLDAHRMQVLVRS